MLNQQQIVDLFKALKTTVDYYLSLSENENGKSIAIFYLVMHFLSLHLHVNLVFLILSNINNHQNGNLTIN